MNRIDPSPPLVVYEDDFALWCAQQGALLRAGRTSSLDRENLAEEIESLGRSQEDEIESRLNVLVMHLLKWCYQPQKCTPSWRATIIEQRMRISKRLKASPSLRNYPATVLDEEYVTARLRAAGETGLSEVIFPEGCPFTIEEILDPAFFPEGR
ncbi:DUF29 domain-containing protein [Kumtagia ephedrae]|uniref:DUF29 domain-containing protein n=1 Tax=Kumtagia ephedrae TaxID=2116701 RepID=A0A2P7S1G0_9HYPH|nr:DUF29 domain-containing protein [Mesorhizobium ephedrae]PSJ56314.1 DUF29 domain-containing protein [Mesorhizobium ephedrae]